MKSFNSLKEECKDLLEAEQRTTLHGFSMGEALKAGSIIGVDWNKVDQNEFLKGMNVELEHRDITKGNRILTAKIVLAHLDEISDYYTRLEKMEQQYEKKEQAE